MDQYFGSVRAAGPSVFCWQGNRPLSDRIRSLTPLAWTDVNDRTGRRKNSGRGDQKRSGGPQRKDRNTDRKPSRGDGRRDSRTGPSSRGANSPKGNRGPGVEKPERHFGSDARGSKWGGVARRGAHNASIDTGAPRPAAEELPPPTRKDHDRWERVGDQSSKPHSGRRPPQMPLPELDAAHTRHLSKRDRERLLKQLREAGQQFLSDRFGAVDDILRPLIKKHPQVPDLHELYGLTLYRLGRWNQAVARLQTFTDMTGSIDQLPVMADCYRALGNSEEVRRLWDELRLAGAEAAIISEGRIVMAGTLADTGDLAGGIRLLEQGPIRPKRARDYHLRLWYALSDLYEKAGDYQRARRGFERIQKIEAGYADVEDRLASLT